MSAVGAGGKRIKPGDRVLPCCPGERIDAGPGGRAQVYKIPMSLPFEHAAAFTTVYHTSDFAPCIARLFDPAKRCWCNGAAGGVGVSAVRLPSTWRKGAWHRRQPGEARVVKSTRRDEVFDSRDPAGQGVQRATGNKGQTTSTIRSAECVRPVTQVARLWRQPHVLASLPEHPQLCDEPRHSMKNISLVGLHWGALQFQTLRR